MHGIPILHHSPCNPPSHTGRDVHGHTWHTPTSHTHSTHWVTAAHRMIHHMHITHGTHPHGRGRRFSTKILCRRVERCTTRRWVRPWPSSHVHSWRARIWVIRWRCVMPVRGRLVSTMAHMAMHTRHMKVSIPMRGSIGEGWLLVLAHLLLRIFIFCHLFYGFLKRSRIIIQVGIFIN